MKSIAVPLVLAVIIFCRPVFSQNLVPNPSFECGVDNCSATGSFWELPTYACSWSSPNRGTPDILSINTAPNCWCALPQVISYPNNIGTQIPRTGSRVAGIYTFGVNATMQEVREYLQVEIASPLVTGDSYCAEMYVSLAEGVHRASNNIGMAFVETSLAETDYDHIPLTHQIIESTIIQDTLNWVRIAGVFMATAPAEYLIIGNFYGNDATLTTSDMTGFITENAYYFIDDVSVEKIPSPEISFSGEFSICRGDTVKINATAGTDYIEWYDTDNPADIVHIGKQLKATPEKTTIYIAKSRGCGITFQDTVTVIVRPTPDVDLGGKAIMCEGSSLTLDAGADQESYTWNDHSQDRYLTVADTGHYSVTVRNSVDCESVDSVHVSMQRLPRVDIGKDTVVCNEFFPLVGNANNDGVIFQWSDGSNDSIFVPVASGKYWLTVENHCGIATDSIHVYSIIEDIFVPNVLTLNGDTLNNRLMVSGLPSHQSSMISIFNRWGREIYSSKSYFGDWPDASQDLATGMYYYVLSYPGCRDYKGWVHILK